MMMDRLSIVTGHGAIGPFTGGRRLEWVFVRVWLGDVHAEWPSWIRIGVGALRRCLVIENHNNCIICFCMTCCMTPKLVNIYTVFLC